MARESSIHVTPATRAKLITMLGEQITIEADEAWNVEVKSSSSPVYVRGME